MTYFSIFDENEQLMLMLLDYQTYLSQSSSFFQPNFSEVHSKLTEKFTNLQKFSISLFTSLTNTLIQEQQRSESLSKLLNFSKQQVKKFQTQQQKISDRHSKIKLENKSLSLSLKKLKKLLKSEVKHLDISLKKQRKKLSKLSFQHNADLEHLENELKTAFEDSGQEPNPGDISQEFEQLVMDMPLDRQDNSRISMEKNDGGWESEYESSDESRCQNEDIRQAIIVLAKAGLISEENSLSGMSKLIEEIGEESLELVKQIASFRAKDPGDKILEVTQSLVKGFDNEINLKQTLVSPGSKNESFFI